MDQDKSALEIIDCAIKVYLIGLNDLAQSILQDLRGKLLVPPSERPSCSSFSQMMDEVKLLTSCRLEFLSINKSLFLVDGGSIGSAAIISPLETRPVADSTTNQQSGRAPSQQTDGSTDDHQQSSNTDQLQSSRLSESKFEAFDRELYGRQPFAGIPNINGQMSNIEEVIQFCHCNYVLEVPDSVSVRPLVCTQAFTHIGFRDKFHFESQSLYSIQRSSLINEGGPFEHCMVVFRCKYKSGLPTDKGPTCRKYDLCESPLVELRFSQTGIILSYQVRIGTDGEFEATPSHNHAPGIAPRGLSREMKSRINSLAHSCHSVPEIVKIVKQGFSLIGKDLVFSERQIKDCARRANAINQSVETSLDHQRVLDSISGAVTLENDILIAKSLKYSAEGDACLMLSCTSWMQRIVEADTLYLDGTWVDLGNGRPAIILTLVTRGEDGRIKPVVISTAPQEDMGTIEVFFEFALTEMAKAAEVDIDRDETGCFVLPRLRLIMADGIRGLTKLVKRMFKDVCRVNCFFHVRQAQDRWMIKNKIPNHIAAYFSNILSRLSMESSFPDFLLSWDGYRETICEKSSFEDSESNHWTKCLNFFESQYICDSDTNHWCRALLEQENLAAERLSRSTVSESFIHSLKTALHGAREGAVAENQLHLEQLLVKAAFPKLHVNYNKPVNKGIPRDHWNQASLLVSLIGRMYPNLTLKCSSTRLAFHYGSGMIYGLSDVPEVSQVFWRYGANSDPEIFFTDFGEYALAGEGFCIINSAEHCFPTDKKWYRSASCTCSEFLARCHEPCSHVLAIYLIMNHNLDQDEACKLGNSATLTDLLKAQKSLENGSSSKGHFFPNGTDSGNEFVHFFLTNRNSILQTQLDKAQAAINSFKKKKIQKLCKKASVGLLKVLQRMNDDRLRKKIVQFRRNRDGRPLPGTRAASESDYHAVKLSRSLTNIDFFDSQSNDISQNKRMKLSEKRSGKVVAKEDFSRACGRLLR